MKLLPVFAVIVWVLVSLLLGVSPFFLSPGGAPDLWVAFAMISIAVIMLVATFAYVIPELFSKTLGTGIALVLSDGHGKIKVIPLHISHNS